MGKLKKTLLLTSVGLGALLTPAITASAQPLHAPKTGNNIIQQKKNGAIVQGEAHRNSSDIYSLRQIAWLSARYESCGNPAAISHNEGDIGGASYGAWQFSSNMDTLFSFVSWLKYNDYPCYLALENAKAKDNWKYGLHFNSEWRYLGETYPTRFYNLQLKYVNEYYFIPLVRKMSRYGGFQRVLSNLAVQNVLLSTAIQNGVNGAFEIIRPLRYQSPSNFINNVYNRRSLIMNGCPVNFYSSSKDIQDSVLRRLNLERKSALSLL